MAQSTTATANPASSFPENSVTDIPIFLSGMTGPVAALTFRFDNFTTDQILGLGFLLAAPDGTSNIVFLSDDVGYGLNNQTLYFTDADDESSLSFPVLKPFDRDSHRIIQEIDYDPALTINHAPYNGTATFASAFNGIDPNGTWHLYVLNDVVFANNVTIGSVTLQIVTNVAPVISGPALQTVLTGSTLTFSNANGNLPTSIDPDADMNDGGRISLTVEHGLISNDNVSLDFSPTKSYQGGAGIDGLVELFLDGLVYTPDPGFTGVDHLTITMSDSGELGLRSVMGNLTTTRTIDIEVFAHPDATDGDDSFTASGYQKIDGGAGKDTITFGFGLTQATVTYDDNTVTIEGAGTKTVVSGFEKFVFNDGTVDNADGNPLIDDLFYYTRSHDVWAANWNADEHYAVYGWREGRDPNAFFDTSGYLAIYADVQAAGINPLEHYDQFGWKEGRNPSLAFDTAAYLAAYQDVAAANVDPLAHFLMFGDQEGRHAFSVLGG
jgi:hypothetical protein